MAHAAIRAMVTSRSELLLPRAVSESMLLLQLGSVVVSEAQITTGGHRSDACGNPKGMLGILL